MGLRVLMLPVVAGIAYEFNRFAGLHNNIITKILRAPGMAMQRFTTKEPDDDMIEVAIIALKKALEFDEGKAVPCCETIYKKHDEDTCIKDCEIEDNTEHDDITSKNTDNTNNE